MIAENQPMDGVASQQYLEKELERAGVPSDYAKKIIGVDGLSKAGADKVIYEVAMHDPKTMIDEDSWDDSNVLRGIHINSMAQTTLMYDIREELKNLTAVLGALGGVMTDQTRGKDLDAQTNGQLTNPK